MNSKYNNRIFKNLLNLINVNIYLSVTNMIYYINKIIILTSYNNNL